jgi:hypothetical protein
VSRVYASLPLTGPQARLGNELLRGAELALERAGPVAEYLGDVTSSGVLDGASPASRRWR